MDAAGGDYRLADGSDLIDAGIVLPGINAGYGGDAPDIGAFEVEAPSAPAVTLHATPGDRQIVLTWEVAGTPPVLDAWRITYDTATTAYLPVTVISPTRAHVLTGLTNYVWYTITLDAIFSDTVQFSDTVRAMPTDIMVYLPLVLRH